MGIDNAYVDVSAEEVPIMDAAPDLRVSSCSSGIEEQASPKKYIRVLRTVTIEQGDKR